MYADYMYADYTTHITESFMNKPNVYNKVYEEKEIKLAV